jgi:heme exporter protein A
MKQRMKLAFAMMARPPLLLLDEPGSNLDDAGRALLASLVEEAARTALVVVATNDPAEAAWAGARVELAA